MGNRYGTNSNKCRDRGNYKTNQKYLPDNKVLYGGSANEKNIEELRKISIIDGYLLGGLSLKPAQLKIFLEKLEN